jgi:hypothetical protein
MALVLADRVREGTNTAGTGTVTLTGAVAGFASFADQIGNGNTTYYTITDGANWEVGVGTYNAGTLSRDTVLDSSTGSKINFAAGFKDVFVTLPAEKVVTTDTSGTMSTQNANAVAITGGTESGVTHSGDTIGTYLDYTGTSAPSYAEGRSWYDAAAHALAYYNDSANAVVHIGQDLQIKVINNTGSTIANGSPVYITGTSSGQTYPNIALAKADVAATSAVIGLTNGAIANGAIGYVTSQGGIDNVNTGTFTVGQVLYLSPYSAGQLMNTIPPTGITVQVGVVSFVNSSTGKIYVKQTTPLNVPASIISGAVAVANGGTGATDAAGARTNLGLGTIATQNANAVAITGGAIDNTPIGGTTPAAGKFTTLTSTGTATLGNASTTYVQAIGDASYPGVYAAGGTNTPLVLQPLGTGALQAQKTDSTATGGNARGANAVDWQTSRSVASQVASGAPSVIAGGAGNTASGGYSVVGGGGGNGTGGFMAVTAGGWNNACNGYIAVVGGGYGNSSNGYYNLIGGGYTNSGTSGSVVTTQSGTMNATTAVTLSGSNASIKVGQYITGTSIASDTYVAAISGTSLTLSKNASGSSTSTLSFYTPHGVVVGGGNNQATGSYSFIGGGGDAGTAANRNVASGDWSFVGGGKGNTASGIGAVIVGGGIGANNSVFANTASGYSSFIGGGIGHTVTGQYTAVLGGSFNSATGVAGSVIAGRYATDRSISGISVLTSGYNPLTGLGTSQASVLILARQTTDATPTVLLSDSGSASATNQIALPNNSAYYFRGTVVAGVTGGGNTKGWYIEGVIKRGSGVGTTALVGTPTVISSYADVGAATWALTATADTTNGGLAITFTGQASTTIRCVAKIETTEMTY